MNIRNMLAYGTLLLCANVSTSQESQLKPSATQNHAARKVPLSRFADPFVSHWDRCVDLDWNWSGRLAQQPCRVSGHSEGECSRTRHYAQSVLRRLKYGRSPKLPTELENIFQLLASLGIGLNQKDRLEAIVVYIMTINNSIPIEDLRSTIHRLFSVEIEPGSIADQFRQEGRQEGERRGALIGTIQTCQSLLGGSDLEPESLGIKTVEELTTLADQLQA